MNAIKKQLFPLIIYIIATCTGIEHIKGQSHVMPVKVDIIFMGPGEQDQSDGANLKRLVINYSQTVEETFTAIANKSNNVSIAFHENIMTEKFQKAYFLKQIEQLSKQASLSTDTIHILLVIVEAHGINPGNHLPAVESQFPHIIMDPVLTTAEATKTSILLPVYQQYMQLYKGDEYNYVHWWVSTCNTPIKSPYGGKLSLGASIKRGVGTYPPIIQLLMSNSSLIISAKREENSMAVGEQASFFGLATIASINSLEDGNITPSFNGREGFFKSIYTSVLRSSKGAQDGPYNIITQQHPMMMLNDKFKDDPEEWWSKP